MTGGVPGATIAAGEEAYSEGVAAYQEGRLAEARRRFEDAVRDLPSAHRLAAQAWFGLGQTLNALFDGGAVPEVACRARDAYTQFLDATTDGDARVNEVRRRAAEARDVLAVSCVEVAPVATASQVDRSRQALGWVLGGGAVLAGLTAGGFHLWANQAQSEADRATSERRADELDELAGTRRTIGWGLLGVGALLAAGATWAFLTSDLGTGTATLSPSGAGWAWHF